MKWQGRIVKSGAPKGIRIPVPITESARLHYIERHLEDAAQQDPGRRGEALRVYNELLQACHGVLTSPLNLFPTI